MTAYHVDAAVNKQPPYTGAIAVINSETGHFTCLQYPFPVDINYMEAIACLIACLQVPVPSVIYTDSMTTAREVKNCRQTKGLISAANIYRVIAEMLPQKSKVVYIPREQNNLANHLVTWSWQNNFTGHGAIPLGDRWTDNLDSWILKPVPFEQVASVEAIKKLLNPAGKTHRMY